MPFYTEVLLLNTGKIPLQKSSDDGFFLEFRNLFQTFSEIPWNIDLQEEIILSD